jgi:hypothetical protein
MPVELHAGTSTVIHIATAGLFYVWIFSFLFACGFARLLIFSFLSSSGFALLVDFFSSFPTALLQSLDV